MLIAGCLYLANGGGNIIGARIIGREFSLSAADVAMADATVRRYMVKRGHRRPEDRLRAAVLGIAFVMPLSCGEFIYV